MYDYALRYALNFKYVSNRCFMHVYPLQIRFRFTLPNVACCIDLLQFTVACSITILQATAENINMTVLLLSDSYMHAQWRMNSLSNRVHI